MSYKALFYDEGVFASRPAASVGDSYVYFATDTGDLYRSNGSTWTLIGSTGGGSGIPQGGPLTEALDADGFTITNLVDPTADQEAATKKYVDDNAGGSFDLAAEIHAATGKTTPVDNDELALVDSAASNVLKKLLWSNVKATLKTYFDTLYASSSGSAPIGTPELIYRYTVTGSDKASIDTGADTADAGSNDWTGGDLLEVWIYPRSDSAGGTDTYNIVLNNDTTSGNYRVDRLQVNNTTVSGSEFGGTQTSFQITSVGGGDAANNFGCIAMTFPNFAGTVGHKQGECRSAMSDDTAGNAIMQLFALRYKSTSAITRLKVSSNTAGKLLKVGTQVLIYKRRST